ncbi:MAG: polymer-forming cytoskeletal protein [Gammaproteobacteria bacterium]|nr:polymer-forming cytoskeletal protein [Gammaproteobacteria bacterium]
MFKKPEPETPRTEPVMKNPETSRIPAPRNREPATIGPTIRINGDLSGDEDVIVQGSVEGTVTLRENVLQVGKDGKINATVNARVITVEGRVEGDLHGGEQVVVQRSGVVRGNITAPRVTLEDGCKFKGSIDMDVEPVTAAKQGGSSSMGEKIADFKPATLGSGDAPAKVGIGKGPGQ